MKKRPTEQVLPKNNDGSHRRKKFTPVYNRILEALFSLKIVETELKIVLFVLRYSVGCNREWAELENWTELRQAGVSKNFVKKKIKDLAEKKIIVVEGETKKLKVNERTEEWLVEPCAAADEGIRKRILKRHLPGRARKNGVPPTGKEAKRQSLPEGKQNPSYRENGVPPTGKEAEDNPNDNADSQPSKDTLKTEKDKKNNDYYTPVVENTGGKVDNGMSSSRGRDKLEEEAKKKALTGVGVREWKELLSYDLDFNFILETIEWCLQNVASAGKVPGAVYYRLRNKEVYKTWLEEKDEIRKQQVRQAEKETIKRLEDGINKICGFSVCLSSVYASHKDALEKLRSYPEKTVFRHAEELWDKGVEEAEFMDKLRVSIQGGPDVIQMPAKKVRTGMGEVELSQSLKNFIREESKKSREKLVKWQIECNFDPESDVQTYWKNNGYHELLKAYGLNEEDEQASEAVAVRVGCGE